MTSLFCQLTSKLYTLNQVKLKIKFYLFRLKTVRRACSECNWYSSSTTLITSDIQLSSLEMLFILYMSMSSKSLQVFKQCFSTKLWLMKILVVLELSQACIDTDLAVSVVSRKIERYKKVLQALRVLIIEYGRSLFSHLKHLTRTTEIVNEQIGASEMLLSLSVYFSISTAVNLFTSD